MDEGRKYKTQTEWVVQALREAILSGEIRPGERLRQEEVAQQLGTSPTPVREAFRQLEVEGLVVHLPHKGVRVTELSVEDIQEVYLIRSTLESLAARLAVTRSTPDALDKLAEKLESLQRSMEDCLRAKKHKELTRLHDDFHMAVYEAANSQRLCQIITTLRTLFPRNTLWTIPQRDKRSMEEHRQILQAIRDKDADQTGRLTSKHVEGAMHSLVNYLRQAGHSPSGSDDVIANQKGRR